MATDLKIPVSNPPPDIPINTVDLSFSQSLESSKSYRRFAKLGLPKDYKYAKPLPDENNYTIVETISEGNFTCVYKALYEKPPTKEDMENFFDLFGQSSFDTGPQLVVLKKIRMNTHEDKEWEELKKELYILKALNTDEEKCRYVVECSGWYHQDDSIFLIFEHVNGCMFFQDQYFYNKI
uniref:Protein kinase domain-containing protein n=1 Tax=Acrobeloides nanus TaxID=290746 RepID=A0A914DAB7_9BILA